MTDEFILAEAAYNTFIEGAVSKTPWEDISRDMKERWRKAAEAVAVTLLHTIKKEEL
jgi:hypothetical protein